MKRVTITMMTVILVVGLAELSLSQFYYGGGREIPLGIDSTKVVLRFHDNVTEVKRQQVLASIDRVVGVVDDSNTVDDYIVCSPLKRGLRATQIGSADRPKMAPPYKNYVAKPH